MRTHGHALIAASLTAPFRYDKDANTLIDGHRPDHIAIAFVVNRFSAA